MEFKVQGLGPAPAPYSRVQAQIPKPETLHPEPDEIALVQGLARGWGTGTSRAEASCVGSSHWEVIH